MTTYLVELYWPDMRESAVRRLLSRLERAAHLAGADGVDVQYRGCTLMLSDEACLLFFDGPSPEAVAGVCQRAQLVPDRIVEAVELGRGGGDGA